MHFVRFMAAACLLLGPALSSAQPGSGASANAASSPAAPADPLDPGAPVPSLPSLDVLAGYLPFQAQAVAPWRQTNAQVAPGALPAKASDAPAATPGPAAPGNGGGSASAPGGHARHH
ncbi:hypothetical protein AB4Z48_19755 [Cupriavidus sp. 2TAF22]|uniref:hypothetical protein n=1 Tax=unclassified Cupriavidus TaxID=2640874 RepID=UPI003F8E45DC